MSALVIARNDEGRLVAVGPVMARNTDRLRTAVAEHGWVVVDIAAHLSVAAFQDEVRARGCGR